jgi:hypothetical protein
MSSDEENLIQRINIEEPINNSDIM